MEKFAPFTTNDNYFLKAKQEKYTYLINRRQRTTTQQATTQPTSDQSTAPRKSLLTDDELLAELAARGRAIKSLSELSRLEEPDKYEKELRVISEVLAYFRVAYKRIIDNITMRIEQHFVRAFSDMVKMQLISELGLVGEGGVRRCAVLAADPPEVHAKREEILRQWEILEKAQEILQSIKF
jgi:hypothetical protein